MIAGRGTDWEFKVRWQLVGLVGGLLEPGDPFPDYDTEPVIAFSAT